MSLINDALRDLDLREQNACVAAKDSMSADKSSLPRNNFETIPERSNETMGGVGFSERREKYLLYGIIAVLVLLCGGYVSLHQKVFSSSQKDSGSVELIGPLSKRGEIIKTAAGKNQRYFNVEERQSQSTNVEQRVSAEKKDVVNPEFNKQSSIRGLVSLYLEKSSRSIALNHLSVPVKNNAIHFLNEALKLDPENDHALGELKRIAGLYILQVDYALAQGNVARAKTLISRYEKFGLNRSSRERYLAEIEIAEREENTVLNVAVTDDKAAVDRKQIKSKDSSWVKVTSESEDLQKVVIAKNLFSQGDYYAAIRLLEGYIARQPPALNSLICLFDFHIGDSDYSKAQFILSGLSDTHVARTYFEAKITSHFFGVQKAIAVLESSAPNESMKEKQGAYLAALYQKEKRYQESQTVYMELLRIDENNPRYLLGFAVAADARGESFSSLRAYKKLLFVGHSSDKVASFVKKRVKTLSASSQKEVSAW